MLGTTHEPDNDPYMLNRHLMFSRDYITIKMVLVLGTSHWKGQIIMFVHTHKRWLFSLLLVLLFSVTSRLTLAQGKQGYSVTIDPANFVSAIDNPYNPRLPGMKWVYEGKTANGTERAVIEILSETREVMGVQTTIMHDSVYLDGVLTEDTLDWFAQDKDGNVW